MNFFLLKNIKMPTTVGILIFISRKKFMLSSAVQEKKFNLLVFYFLMSRQISFIDELSKKKSFITSGPEL